MIKVIFMYQVIEENHSVTNEPNEDITISSEFVHKTYKAAIDELYNKGYRYKDTDKQDNTEYFYKHKLDERIKRKEHNQDNQVAHIRYLTLAKEEVEHG